MNDTSPRTDVAETLAQEEPAITLRLTRSQVLALLTDSRERHFPDLDSSDATVTLFSDLKTWYFANREDAVTSYSAQVRDNHDGALWRTVGASRWTAQDAAWGGLTNEMQRKGLRYSELSAHIADMEAGEELTAEDGSGFRIVAPGQNVNR